MSESVSHTEAWGESVCSCPAVQGIHPPHLPEDLNEGECDVKPTIEITIPYPEAVEHAYMRGILADAIAEFVQKRRNPGAYVDNRYPAEDFGTDFRARKLKEVTERRDAAVKLRHSIEDMTIKVLEDK